MKRLVFCMTACLTFAIAGWFTPAAVSFGADEPDAKMQSQSADIEEEKPDIKIQRQGEEIQESLVESENEHVRTVQRNTRFGNGDLFWIRRYMFKEANAQRYNFSFTIPGNTIQIQSVSDANGLDTNAAKTGLKESKINTDTDKAKSSEAKTDVNAAKAESNAAKINTDTVKTSANAAKRDLDADKAESNTAQTDVNAAIAESNTAQTDVNAAKTESSESKISTDTVKKESSEAKKWVSVTESAILNTTLPKTTLFITTDKQSMIIGIPALYKQLKEEGNMEAIAGQERPVSIEKGDGQYIVSFSFLPNPQYIGEIWVLQSEQSLFEMNEWDKKIFMANDLASQWRLSMDGYYQKTYASYIPAGPNVYFRQTSCYAGGAFLRGLGSHAAYDLGYVLMKTSLAGQNQRGYFTTPAQSDWLYKDFGIGKGFYDTRFSTDFAMNLLDAYALYEKEDFWEAVQRYGEFYRNYAAVNSYQTQNGILVADYWHEQAHKKTHVSLNHHLSGLHFMLKMYLLTEEEEYLSIAMSMADGIEDTQEQWLLPDGNLRYALFYEGAANTMTDYPYLTYNDLYWVNSQLTYLLKIQKPSIQRLMESKKRWMIANEVHGYYGEEETVSAQADEK